MKHSFYYLHALSGLHVGIGPGTGIIDMPVAREKASNLPQIPGSAIKGVLREELRGDMETGKVGEDDYLALFGPEPGENASEHAGALTVGDARLLSLPIRSWCGTFAWATCPMILRRYRRDLNIDQSIPEPEPAEALHFTRTALKDGDQIYLEDLNLMTKTNTETDNWAGIIEKALFSETEQTSEEDASPLGEETSSKEKSWAELFKERFVILPDDLFDFLAETATEIRARIRIQEGTRTVRSGALWYEEYLPAETLFWGLVAADRSRKPGHTKDKAELLNMLPAETRLQIGGNATVGAGQTRWLLQL